MQTSLTDYYRYTHFKLDNNSQNKLETSFCSEKDISLEEDELTGLEEIFQKRFQKYLPKKEKENDISNCIKESIRRFERKNLYEKYIISIYIILNKEEIKKNRNCLKDINIVFIRALIEEKKNLEKKIFVLNNNLNSIYININIFIGLLINLINLLEISNITINNLIKNQFIKKLNILFNFLKCCLIPNFININPKYKEVSLKFLIKKFEKILSKWKKQADCYELSQKIIDFFGKRKSSLLGKKKLRENTNDDDINNSSTESGENFIKDLNNKKVEFDLHENETYYYDQNDIVSS